MDVDLRVWGFAVDSAFCVCSAEQECHLLKDQVDAHNLDQNPGYKIKDKNAETCGDTELNLEECEQAMLALDWKVINVAQINDANLPTGCFRQQEADYRFLHNESSYLWYYNEADGVNTHSDSEPVCKGQTGLSGCCVPDRLVLLAL